MAGGRSGVWALCLGQGRSAGAGRTKRSTFKRGWLVGVGAGQVNRQTRANWGLAAATNPPHPTHTAAALLIQYKRVQGCIGAHTWGVLAMACTHTQWQSAAKHTPRLLVQATQSLENKDSNVFPDQNAAVCRQRKNKTPGLLLRVRWALPPCVAGASRRP